MKKHIILDNKRVSYTLRKSQRARRMRLAVYCDGSVVVTAPFDLKEGIVDKFMHEKARWLFSKIAFFAQFKNRPMSRYSRDDYIKYKNKAFNLALERVEYFNKRFGYDFNKINIKNQKTRWGSCSRKGNLNFNYKILFLPKDAADYIIVHELCHLKEFNHSKKFWKLVSDALPNYKKIRADLKSYSMDLG